MDLASIIWILKIFKKLLNFETVNFHIFRDSHQVWKTHKFKIPEELLIYYANTADICEFISLPLKK